MELILYSKPGCHLCEGLAEKLSQVQGMVFELEIRDITTCPEWLQAYQYEIPVLCKMETSPTGEPVEVRLPRLSPRATVQHIEKVLHRSIAV